MALRVIGLPGEVVAAVCQAVAEIGDWFGDAARVTLVVRLGGTGEDADDFVATDDDLGAVAAACLHAEATRGHG